MSRTDDNRPKDSAEGLRAVEKFWQVRLPASFQTLYRHFTHPFLAPCEFFSLRAIASGAGRSFGQLPQYLPFGRAVGEGGSYGFYITPSTSDDVWPVLYWDEDERYLRPVASDFEAFLRYCILLERYETEEQWPEEVQDWQQETERREMAQVLSLPTDLFLRPVPRSDTELYESLVRSDSLDSLSLCHLGCAQRSRGYEERALDFYHRASEAAPWFGDPYYLIADIHREKRGYVRAVQCWWEILQRPLVLNTCTWEYDLGEDHPEADIVEVAADALIQFSDAVDADIKMLPLWRAVVQDDPYDPDAREELARTFLAHNDLESAERELLNGLSLGFAERTRQPERLYETLVQLYERRSFKRDAALARFDRTLPRPED